MLFVNKAIKLESLAMNVKVIAKHVQPKILLFVYLVNKV